MTIASFLLKNEEKANNSIITKKYKYIDHKVIQRKFQSTKHINEDLKERAFLLLEDALILCFFFKSYQAFS